jgi:hypothetical protein
MSRRAVVLVLATVIAVAVAIPALAASGTTAKPASVKGLSVRALGKAKAALRTARTAKRSVGKANAAATDAEDAAQAAKVAATAAGASATSAQAAASTAKTDASQAFEKAASAREVAGGAELNSKETKAELAATRPKIGFAEGKASTESESFVPLGGPTVTVDVPTSNLVQVWGSALIDAEGFDEGAVSLYEDGHPAEGQADCQGGVKDVLFSGAPLSPGEPVQFSTPAAFNPISGGCGTLGAPGPVLFRSTTGEHSFEFRYAACACGSPPAEKITFSQRRLVIAPLP